jgi:hypothetical protein
MQLLLINPSNPLVSIVNLGESRWNQYRVWQPLSLMALAGLTPPDWEITIVDENLGVPDYAAMPRPDLVGITVHRGGPLSPSGCSRGHGRYPRHHVP